MSNQEIFLSRKSFYSVGLASSQSEHGTGANLALEVRLAGKLDPQTDLVVNLTDVQKALDGLHDSIDHKHFQYDVPDFKGDPSSHRDIALYCWEKLETPLTFKNAKLYELEMQFGDHCSVIVTGKSHCKP